MQRIPIRDLFGSKPRSTIPTNRVWSTSEDSAVEWPPPSVDGYVWPDVIAKDNSDTASPIVLLSAPGAMGKSAAAIEIAIDLGAPYLDLATIQVGSNSLTGELTKSLGWEGAASFVQALKAGEASIVLDSLDEAQLRSGRKNFQAFIEDLAWILADAGADRQVVMLGRRDVVETTQLTLMDFGLSVPRYEIAPMSRDQACNLIDVTLDLRPYEGAKFNSHRRHAEPFGQLRDAVLDDLAQALESDAGEIDSWDAVSSFLGYPPVVMAVAERLAVDNPANEYSVLKRVGEAASRRNRGALLKQVVEQVLDRESDKVRLRLGDRLGLARQDPLRSTLYTHEEQTMRVLKLTGTSGLELAAPASLPAHERAQYEEHIDSFVEDHPFVVGRRFANVVFSDYLRAWAVTSPSAEVHATEPSAFRRTLPKAGPFYSHFASALSVTNPPSIPESEVDGIIKSFQLGSERGLAVYVHGGGDDGALSLHADDQGSDDALQFSVTDTSGVVEISSPVSRTVIVSEYGVVVRPAGDSVILGPQCAIVADEIDLGGRQITVDGGRESEVYVTTISTRPMRHDAEVQVSVYPNQTALSVYWPEMWHQWSAYAADLASFNRPVPQYLASKIVLGLRRILTVFRSNLDGDPSVSSEKLDQLVVAPSATFIAVLKALEALGVVNRQSGLCILNLSALAEYRVSWTSLHREDPARALRPLIDAVVGTSIMQNHLDNETAG